MILLIRLYRDRYRATLVAAHEIDSARQSKLRGYLRLRRRVQADVVCLPIGVDILHHSDSSNQAWPSDHSALVELSLIFPKESYARHYGRLTQCRFYILLFLVLQHID